METIPVNLRYYKA